MSVQKYDWVIAIGFGFAITVFAFIAGLSDGLDKALEAQERHNRLSVYCQQVGSLDPLCADLRAANAAGVIADIWSVKPDELETATNIFGNEQRKARH